MSSLHATLRSFGLSENVVKVYIYLSKIGPQKASKIANSVGISRVQLYSILKVLQEKGMAESTFEYPAQYSAVPFTKVFDMFLKRKEEEVHLLNKKKNSIIKEWSQISVNEKKNEKSKFMVIQGRSFTYSKIKQMVQQSKKTVDIVVTSRGIIQAYQSGILDIGFNHPQREKIFFRFITDSEGLAPGIVIINELLRRAQEASMCVETRITELASGKYPIFIIIDERELIFFIELGDVSTQGVQDTGFWTNNIVLILAFKAFFEQIWQSSTDFYKK